AVEEQSIPRKDYEVIVCDSASGDGTREMMADLMAEYSNLRHIDLDVNTLSSKRNAGIREARSPLIIFLDDDAIPAHGFVEAHIQAHEAHDNQFICGNVRFPAAWIGRSNYFRFRDSRHLGPSRPDVDPEDIPYHMIVVMNGSFRREDVLNRVGPVSEEFARYGGEDYEFGYRIARAGLRIRFAPTALVEHHEHGGSIRQYMKKLYITSRDSLPVLDRLAPGSRTGSISSLLEAANPAEGWKKRLTRGLVRLLLADWCVRLAARRLEETDGKAWCYSPWLFRYAFAGAMLRGVRDRERAGNREPSDGRLARQGAGWFE
ncbi:MAG TPA: glycosyltransferase, partial [Bryobacteraceae bacterium]